MRMCTVSECGKKHYGCGFCVRHYYKKKKYGDTSKEVTVVDGRSNHPLYITWSRMIGRCSSKATKKDFPFYYGKGIEVCEQWSGPSGFWKFVEDMGERPEGTSIDRIDESKNYSKENCRWATPHQQSANTSRSKKNISGVTGVSFVRHRGTWDARIMVNRKLILLGTFKEKQKAIDARENAEKKYGITL